MKKLILIFFVSFISCKVVPSNNYDSDLCILLEKAATSEHFKREFFICGSEIDFILFDQPRTFNKCKSLSVCDKVIQISHDEKYLSLIPNERLLSKDKSLLILHRVDIEDNLYTLYFWRPYSGAGVNLTFRKEMGKFELIDHTIGSF